MAMGQDDAIAGSAGTVNGQANQDTLQAVIESDTQLQAKLKECYDSPISGKTVSECLWEDKLSQSDKERIRALIQQAQEAQMDSDPSSGGRINSTVAGVKINDIAENAEDSPDKKALKKLGDFFENRLDEAFKATDEKLNVTDQAVYFQLAKTQIGKNIISAWSSVCIDAGWVEGKLVIFSKGDGFQNSIKQANINALQNTTQTAQKTSGQILSGKYFECVKHLTMVCRQEKGKYQPTTTGASQTDDSTSISAGQGAQEQTIDYRGFTVPKDKSIFSINNISIGDTPDDDDEVETLTKKSQERACEITAYVDGLRRQLKATERVAQVMNQDESIRSNARLQLEKRAGDISDVDVDRLTTITSGDVIAEGSYYKELEAQKQLLKDCEQNAQDSRCADLLANTDEEKARLRNSGLAFMLETEDIKDKIKDGNLETLSDQEKRLILRRIDPTASVEGSGAQLDDQIRNLRKSFENERDALVRSLSSRVDELESNDANLQADTNTALTRLTNKGDDYVQLMHFNNVISGYFNVEGGKTNVRVLDLELQNVANLEGSSNASLSSRFSSSYGSTLQDEIRENNQGLDIGSSNEQNEPVNLTSDQVDQFFDYQIEP